MRSILKILSFLSIFFSPCWGYREDEMSSCLAESELSLTTYYGVLRMGNMDRSCIERCRMQKHLFALRHNDACYCTNESLGTFRGTDNTLCQNNELPVYNISHLEASDSCWHLHFFHAVLEPNDYIIRAQNGNRSLEIEVKCDFLDENVGQGSLLFGLEDEEHRVDGSDWKHRAINPYNPFSNGVDLNGDDWMEIDLRPGNNSEALIRGFKFLSDNDSHSFDLRFTYDRFDDEYWTPSNNLSLPYATFSLSPSMMSEYGDGVYALLDSSSAFKGFAANKVEIRTNAQDFRVDLIGSYYDFDSNRNEALDKEAGCQLFGLNDARVHKICSAFKLSDANKCCRSHCQSSKNVEDKKRVGAGVRKVGPRQYTCHCLQWISHVGGVDQTRCQDKALCRDIEEMEVDRWNEKSRLMPFIQSSDELSILNRMEAPSSVANMCNRDRIQDLAAAYIAADWNKDSDWFYNLELDVDSDFTVWPPGYWYKDPILEVTDPEIIPVYRRVLKVIGNRKSNLFTMNAKWIVDTSLGIFHHCKSQRQILCPDPISNNETMANQTTTNSSTIDNAETFCHDLAQYIQVAYMTCANRNSSGMPWVLDQNCDFDTDLNDVGLQPLKVERLFPRDCSNIDNRINELVASNGNAIPVNTTHHTALPGTRRLYVCQNGQGLSDNSNEPRNVTCKPNLHTNFDELEKCTPIKCLDTEPSEAPSHPANGTRSWDRSTRDNGTWANTQISYSCAPNHAFNSTPFSNSINNECLLDGDKQNARWQFWLEPPINETDDPQRRLPECIPYCFDEVSPPLRSSASFLLAHNVVNQSVVFTCDLGHEFNVNNVSIDGPVAEVRVRTCVEPQVGMGGQWQDDYFIPDQCYPIKCTENRPPALNSSFHRVFADTNGNALANQTEYASLGNDSVIPMEFGHKIVYSCSNVAEDFFVDDNYVDQIVVECTANRTWSRTHLPQCQDRYCINPPLPNASHHLHLANFDANIESTLPAINQTVRYECEGEKRFEHDFNLNFIELVCQETFTIEEPLFWPNCVDNLPCARPNVSALVEIWPDDSNATFAHNDLIRSDLVKVING